MLQSKTTKKILITGASGFIGSQLLNSLKEYQMIGVSRNVRSDSYPNLLKCDLTNQNELNTLIQDIEPDIIYHFAALTNPKINEESPDQARSLNSGITKNLIETIDLCKTHLIFLSTDKVFNGDESNPDELSVTEPLWLYGKEKYECEKLIQERVLKHHIIRLPIVHGSGEKKGFSFIDDALINMSAEEPVNAFENVKRCYVKLCELIDLLKMLIVDTHYGTYHAGSALMSYYERIIMLSKENGIDYEDNLMSVQGNAKPMVQNLNTLKLEKTFNFKFS